MPTSSLIDYRPTGHYSPEWGGARRKAQRDSWREHNHSHYLHPAKSCYCDQRGNVRRVTDFDYSFKPRVHDRLVQDLKEACTHPLGGVHPHTAKLIQDMAESHPDFDRLRNAVSAPHYFGGGPEQDRYEREAEPPSEPEGTPSSVGESADEEARWWAQDLLSSSSSPELQGRSGLALQVGSSDSANSQQQRWRETPAAERYDRQTICASWSQAQLHAFGTSACFGPAAMGLSGRARKRKQLRGSRGSSYSEHTTPSARPRSHGRHNMVATVVPAQEQGAKTMEEVIAGEQAAYSAWYNSDLARPGYRPNLAMQKHQLQLEQERLQMQELQTELPSVMDSATSSEDYDEPSEPTTVDVSRTRVQQWNEESRQREMEHLDKLGWPTQPGTAEYKAQELKLFADRQQRKTEWTLTRSRAKVAACAKPSGRQSRSAGWRPGRRTSQGIVLKLGREAQMLVDIEAKNSEKKFAIVHAALVQTEGVLPTHAEVMAVLECIDQGKTRLPPEGVRK